MRLLMKIYEYILSLRYNVTIEWEKELQHDWPILLMPNHVALVDPQIITWFLYKYLDVSPVVVETYYNKPLLKPLFKLVKAVPMWDLQAWSWDKEEVKRTISSIIDALKEGKNILIYPSGQIYSQWYEVIKGKKSAFTIIENLPENAKVVWIRTTWLWWSIWSKAYNNQKIWFFWAEFYSWFIILANLVFLIPKRPVKIEMFDITSDLKKEHKKWLNDFNKYLEDFYNKNWEEKPEYVRHYFFFNDTKNTREPALIEWSIKWIMQVNNHYNLEQLDPKIKSTIINKIAEMKSVKSSTINDKTNLIIDLYFDSLDLAEIKSYIQTTFEKSSNPPILDLKTVWDLIVMWAWKSANIEKIKPCNWKTQESNKNFYELLNDNHTKLWYNSNILSLFKEVFKNSPNSDFIYDGLFWLQSKRNFLIKCYLISNILKKIKWQNIWIMLPSVSTTPLLIIATYLAGKTPVMLNWTVGEASLYHCINFAGIDNIITSNNFYNKIKNDSLDKISEKYIFLEDILKNVSLVSKITALIKSKLFIIPKKKTSARAVLLFTSGSESLPKAVPLTHSNIIYDILGAIYNFPIKEEDILLGFLPPFHSFWFTINTILPLITWLRLVCFPDPNDSKTISNYISHCKVTTITSTPTFLKMILGISKSKDLQSVKYVAVWAEKCPTTLAEEFSKMCPQAKILEWYGITECSPIISINPPSHSKLWSVWQPIFWLQVKIISLENWKETKTGEQWMIYVKWYNIFAWYLDNNLESPFEQINWYRFYKTWDIGYLDSDNYLYITGRLKRFIKIAWEMISLPFIEEIILEKFSVEWEVWLAIEALENEWTAKIVLFSIYNIKLQEVNDHLRKRWVSNLVRIEQIIKLESIPVLGTGKIDYKILKSKIG